MRDAQSALDQVISFAGDKINKDDVEMALGVAGADILTRIMDSVADNKPAEAIKVIVTPWRRLLIDHDFALGCPLAATICDAADNDSFRTHVSELFAQWRARVTYAYTKFGAPPAEADAHATVLMAALEGALILARAQRSIEPLGTVERFFASRAPHPHRA